MKLLFARLRRLRNEWFIRKNMSHGYKVKEVATEDDY